MLSVFFLFTILSGVAVAQEYYPILGDSGTWYVLHTFEGSYTDISYLLGVDTINSLEYKLYGKPWSSKVPIREDVQERRIYIYQGDSVEVVLYDFSLNEGDSILNRWYNQNTNTFNDIGWYYLDSIRPIEIDAGIRNAFYLHSCWTRNNWTYCEYPIWIEGVGSIGDFMEPFSTPDEWESGSLNCYYLNDSLVYQSDFAKEFGECDIGLYTEGTKLQQNLAYPNPANDVVTANQPYSSADIVLLSISGQVLQKYIAITGNDFSINISDLKSGIYFLKVTPTDRTDGIGFTSKLIKK